MTEINPLLEQVFTEQIQQQNEIENAQRESQRATMAEIDQRRAELLRSLTTTTQNKIKYDPRVVAIANALQGQPLLIVPVEQFLNKLVASINGAVQDAINKASGTEST